MAGRPEFVQYAADQLSDAGTITYRKMFGEYGMYKKSTLKLYRKAGAEIR